jgi:F0F1-type ATP synthase assembly protein I
VGLDRRALNAFSYSTVGLELVVSILFGLFGGHWLDGKLGTDPVWTFVGLAFGIVAGFRFVYRAAVRMRKDSENDEFREPQADRRARFALDEKDKNG